MILDTILFQPTRKSLYFRFSSGPELMVNDQRDSSPPTTAQPNVQQQKEAKTVGAT